ncbi:MAG: threonine aldolase family protein [Deinococcales bacterium]
MIVDLRSDTVTVPTPAMRQAMLEATVGDDVYGEDPTVNALQDLMAKMLGFEAALFTTSGVQANQIAIAAHTQRGQEVICTEGAHIYEYELGMMAAFAGIVPRFVAAPKGIPDPQDIRRAIRRSVHQSPTGLIALENTHNRAGGTVLPLEIIKASREIATNEGLPLHLDGARVWNALEAQQLEPQQLAEHFDSMAVCLSKGLGAPVGSIIAGSKAFIKECHRYRKMLGGGMRQAGILAAAGIYALEHHRQFLGKTHQQARYLAEALGAKGFAIDLERVQTNMVYIQLPDADKKLAAWAQKGVKAGMMAENLVRLVTHFQITDAMLEYALEVIDS